jgi:hypothetical protein
MPVPDYDILIVGAGFSGIGAGVALDEGLHGRVDRGAAAAGPARQRQRRGPSRAARRLIVLTIVAVLFAIVVAVVLTITASSSHDVAHLRSVIAHDAQSAIQSFSDFISKNTK